MFAEQKELKNTDRYFQQELPLIDLLFDEACETLYTRVIRICDYYFPAICEQQA